jgi:quercetin dioxygenase-like cupin family protein
MSPISGGVWAIDLSVDFSAPSPWDMKVVLADERRKLILVTLRRGAKLEDHLVFQPATAHCIAGKGTFRIGRDSVEITPGVLVPLDAEVVHEIEGRPDVAVLLSIFRSDDDAAYSIRMR